MKERIHIVPGSDAEAQLWRTTAEIARLFADWPWVLVGGLPSLLGAIIIKARVATSSGLDKHRRDLARLLALVDDVEPMRQEMSSKERGYLRARSELRDPRHPAWSGIPNSEDAIIARERLSER